MLKILPVQDQVVNCHFGQFLLKSDGENAGESW